AFDAATRGLKVGVVDAKDWASGTSSRSSKLMHGGLRYLEMLDFKLVAEALKERDLLLTPTAPHLVEPVAFVFPFAHRLIARVPPPPNAGHPPRPQAGRGDGPPPGQAGAGPARPRPGR